MPDNDEYPDVAYPKGRITKAQAKAHVKSWIDKPEHRHPRPGQDELTRGDDLNETDTVKKES